MENITNIKVRLEEIIEPMIKDRLLELVDLELSLGNRGSIKIKIDKSGTGVTLDDCTEFSKALDAKLEEEDLIKSKYTLEVSSPGLDRPLNKIEDFVRFKGKLARVVTKTRIDNIPVFIGNIIDVQEGFVVIKDEKSETRIDFDNIKKAKLEVDTF